jgi:hypothetical protein
MYPDDIYCENPTDLDQAKGGSIIYLRSSKKPIFVDSRNNYYRGADLTSKGGVYYVSGRYEAWEEVYCEFIEKDSIYEGNQAIFGGAIYAEKFE